MILPSVFGPLGGLVMGVGYSILCSQAQDPGQETSPAFLGDSCHTVSVSGIGVPWNHKPPPRSPDLDTTACLVFAIEQLTFADSKRNKYRWTQEQDRKTKKVQWENLLSNNCLLLAKLIWYDESRKALLLLHCLKEKERQWLGNHKLQRRPIQIHALSSVMKIWLCVSNPKSGASTSIYALLIWYP